MATNTPAVFYRGNPSYGTTNVQRTVTTADLTSNLVTLTFGSNHGLTQVGTLITVQGVGTAYDGTFPINSFPANNTATYVVTNANIGSASVTPNGSAIFNTGVTVGGALSNNAIVNNVAIITTSSAHGLAIGDIVEVNSGTTGTNGTFTVKSVPSTTLFTFVTSTATLTSAALTQGAFCKFPDVYTLAAATSGIVTDVIITNPSSSDGLVYATIDNINYLDATVLPANATTTFNMKQFFATTKKLSVASTIPQSDIMISGITIV
jgi:hypothetical protein